MFFKGIWRDLNFLLLIISKKILWSWRIWKIKNCVILCVKKKLSMLIDIDPKTFYGSDEDNYRGRTKNDDHLGDNDPFWVFISFNL